MPAPRPIFVAIMLVLAVALTLTTRLCADDGDEAPPSPPRPRITAVDAAEEEEEKDPMMMPGTSADVSSFATGWKSRLSSRKRKGLTAQGLGQQRLGPVGKWQYNV